MKHPSTRAASRRAESSRSRSGGLAAIGLGIRGVLQDLKQYGANGFRACRHRWSGYGHEIVLPPSQPTSTLSCVVLQLLALLGLLFLHQIPQRRPGSISRRRSSRRTSPLDPWDGRALIPRKLNREAVSPLNLLLHRLRQFQEFQGSGYSRLGDGQFLPTRVAVQPYWSMSRL